MYHESDYHNSSSFITLTYSEENLPENKTVKKKDFQDFMKRFRKNVDRKIKYYACGEYGLLGDRPHYHAIVFGLHPKDKNLIDDSWCRGFTDVKLATYDRMKYVAKYINKKYFDELEYDTYICVGRENVFGLQSQGLGKQYALDNKEQILSDGYVRCNGAKCSIPRYYLKVLGVDAESIDRSYSAEKESLLMEKYSGQKMTNDECYEQMTAGEYMVINSCVNLARKQTEKNIKARIDLSQR